MTIVITYVGGHRSTFTGLSEAQAEAVLVTAARHQPVASVAVDRGAVAPQLH